MRIVGGRFRGRRLAVPADLSIRPTSDRNRERLFNILDNRGLVAGARVLDVFAGTGALGLEALSRGAESVIFLDNGAQAGRLIGENIATLDVADASRLMRRDALKPGRHEACDLVFADPPYGKGLGERAVAALRENGWFAEGATLVLEEARDALPERLDGFEMLDRRDSGETALGLFALLS